MLSVLPIGHALGSLGKTINYSYAHDLAKLGHLFGDDQFCIFEGGSASASRLNKWNHLLLLLLL